MESLRDGHFDCESSKWRPHQMAMPKALVNSALLCTHS